MQDPIKYLKQIDLRKKDLIDELCSWVDINSGSDNFDGIELFTRKLESAFAPLNAEIKRVNVPFLKKINDKGVFSETQINPALSIVKRENAPFKVLLAGHMDTVYPKDSLFQKSEIQGDLLKGPGVADMKGGLLIMLNALKILENSPFIGMIGWEVLINTDEEIGSSSSQNLFKERAKKYHAGLIFEPSYPNGKLVNERKGSLNYTLVVRGKSAHAGRDYHAGKNAITAMAKMILEIESLNNFSREITVNVGHFQGGIANNIVPDLSVCRINVRLKYSQDFSFIQQEITKIVVNSKKEGFSFELTEDSSREPKPFDEKNQVLFEFLKACGKELNMTIEWQSSGGVCDGNILSGAGLATIDTMGAIGGYIHTPDEFIYTDSLVEKTRLTALFLMQMACNVTLEKKCLTQIF